MINQRIQINETAYFDTYLLKNSQEYNVNKKRPLVVVLPGGGYVFTSDREAEPIALKFNSVGLHSVVLWYSVYDDIANVPKKALLETAKTIQTIREHADEWMVDPDKIIVCGFSAGGNLTLQMATKWNEPWVSEALGTTKDMIKVNLAIPCYPAVLPTPFPEGTKIFDGSKSTSAQTITIKNTLSGNEVFYGAKTPTQADLDEYNVLNFVDEETPPMFVWNTFEDNLTPVSNALALCVKLKEKHIPFELHVFEKGEHGLALADRTTARKPSHHNTHVYHWFELCEEWLSAYIDA